MQGRRLENVTAVLHGEAGDYSLAPDRKHFAARVPTGDFVNLPVIEDEGSGTENPPVWAFTEHEDGTITIRPSINVHEGPQTQPWHGHLQAGVWNP